ncbi:hypothetical protein CBW65_12845 [Tumebacillus avium]|uniref:Nucleoside 2-deoxyribosyltransferase n=1 Tax=Tumebacillus avium TaxID=1903704 RepID=A0A1Y0IMR7_9BACL|nr:hypothetical protein CBW65_12845 [Tumebacillus avium]
MNKPVFLSYPVPFTQKQKKFIERVCEELEGKGLQPRTLGVTDYDMDAPLTAIRRLMVESNGLLTIAFRRAYIHDGTGKPNSDLENVQSYDISEKWLTSPYCQIEPAMAFQIGLPILIFREKGVMADGILEKGVIGTYLPEFDLDDDLDIYFKQQEWKQLMRKWVKLVDTVYENKGCPPKLY